MHNEDSTDTCVEHFTLQHYQSCIEQSDSQGLVIPDFPLNYEDFDDVPVGTRLSKFVQNWEVLVSDPYVLSIIRDGYRLEFTEPPPLKVNPKPFRLHLNDEQQIILDDEMSKFIDKEVIEEVTDLTSPGFYSTLFLRPKTDSGYRVIINLKPLNAFIVYRKFKMETSASVRQGLTTGDWCFTVDCKDAYTHVMIHPSSRKYLRFFWAGKCWQFRALCFGLSSAPYLFSLLVSHMARWFHVHNVFSNYYLDDWFYFDHVHALLVFNKPRILQVIRSLGWIINVPKSQLDISQEAVYIGSLYDLCHGMVYPTQKRWEKMQLALRVFCSLEGTTASAWAGLLGLLTSTQDVTPLGRLMVRDLQYHLNKHWRNRLNLYTWVPITSECLQVFKWWLQEANVMCGVPLHYPEPTVVIYTDSSSRGYGAIMGDLYMAGEWDAHLRQQHINYQELYCVKLALLHWQSQLQGQSVLVASDNVTVISYINKNSGTHSHTLHQLAKEILLWVHANNMVLRCRHIPGKNNVIADGLSRTGHVIQTEWSLHPHVFHGLTQLWFHPMVDLFATHRNNKCPVYFAPFPEAQAQAVDALTQSWEGLQAYAYPPPALLLKVIQKIQQTVNCTIILVVPKWPRCTWFPHLLHLLIDVPRQLPLRHNLLKQPHREIFHDRVQDLSLHGCLLSGNPSENRAFLKKLQKESFIKTDNQPLNCMKLIGTSSVFGVSGKIIIPACPLYH